MLEVRKQIESPLLMSWQLAPGLSGLHSATPNIWLLTAISFQRAQWRRLSCQATGRRHVNEEESGPLRACSTFQHVVGMRPPAYARPPLLS
jgi:hypothetical protein